MMNYVIITIENRQGDDKVADDELQDNRTVNRKTKDSVFTKVFEDKNNLLLLYKELHPRDTTVTIDDIEIETLKSVMINDIINDLGFTVESGTTAKFILLFEAQSKWTENLTLRMLFYLAETYHRYLIKTKQSEHAYKKINLPKPELYVVYTGSKDLPDEISFKEDYFDGDGPVDIRVKILKKPEKHTIYGQYIGFCKIYDEQRKIHKNKLECIKETIRISLEKGYLTEFLYQHKQEVFTRMSELFDEEAQRKQYDIAIKEQFKAEGRAEGEAKGRAEGEAKLLKKLIKLGNSIKQLSEMFEMPESEIESLLAMDS